MNKLGIAAVAVVMFAIGAAYAADRPIQVGQTAHLGPLWFSSNGLTCSATGQIDGTTNGNVPGMFTFKNITAGSAYTADAQSIGISGAVSGFNSTYTPTASLLSSSIPLYFLISATRFSK